jgi:hypothetical protein
MTPVPPEITVLDAFPDKATYLPGQSATINVVLRNGGTMPFAGQLAADLMYLTAKVADVRAPIAVAGGHLATAGRRLSRLRRGCTRVGQRRRAGRHCINGPRHAE